MQFPILLKKEENTYQQILKATSLFGGVHFFNLAISVVRTKFVAILLGPSGIGLLTLLMTSMTVLHSATGFGLETSGIKSISECLGVKDERKIRRKIIVFKKIIFFTGVFGMLFTILFSSVLSQVVFGNKDYQFTFIWISIAVLFKQLSSGYLTVLQSLNKIKLFAKTNLIANLFSLLITVPIYIYWKIDGIAPGIMVSTGISFVVSYFFAKDLFKSKERISIRNVVVESKEMFFLGLALGFSELIRAVSEYLVQMGINYLGGVDQVGLYGAGLVILNSYVGIIFIVMSKNYYPKLSEVYKQKEKISKMAFEQAYIGVVLITPIILLFFVFVPFIVEFLFSVKFKTIICMVSWGIIAMLFKSLSWSLGYIIIAKGDSKVFIRTSLGFSSLYVILMLLGFYFYEITGLGIAFFIYYMCHFLGIKIIVSKRYGIELGKEIYSIFFKCLLLCLGGLSLSYLPFYFLKYIGMVILALFSIFYSLNLMNRKIPLKELFKSYLRKEK